MQTELFMLKETKQLLSPFMGDIQFSSPDLSELFAPDQVAFHERPLYLSEGHPWLEMLVEGQAIRRRLEELGEASAARFDGQPFGAVWFPDGGFHVAREMQKVWKKLGLNVPFFPLTVKRYTANEQGSRDVFVNRNELAIIQMIMKQLQELGIAVIDDVFDEGIAMQTGINALRGADPHGQLASSQLRRMMSVVLAMKNGARSPEVQIEPDFVGFPFEIEENGKPPWLGGWGMDLAKGDARTNGRNIDAIVALRT